MSSAQSPNQNHLLAALPTAEFERLTGHLERVPMPLGDLLYEPGGQLQHAGFIHYRRGHIAVLDRAGLETRACECYAVVKTELSRLLSDVQYRQGTSPVIR